VAVDAAGAGLKADAAATRGRAQASRSITTVEAIFAQRLMWLKAVAAGSAMIGSADEEVAMSHFAKTAHSHTAGTPVKGNAGIREDLHDPYQPSVKPAEPTWCPQCGAVFEQGRWQWKERLSAHAPQLACAACRRIHDNMPAGIVQIEGDFAREHREEMLAMLNHRAERAKAEHPLQRIMGITDTATGLELTTTDIHLAHELAQALHHAYHGDLKLHYSDKQVLLRAHWQR
jgi:hypothetical protein